MSQPQAGEVWLVDLGLAAKMRPCLLLGDYPTADELALIIVVPHTTSTRGNRWELAINKRFLKSGVFHLQQLQSVPIVRLKRKLGVLTPEEFKMVKDLLVILLNLGPSLGG